MNSTRSYHREANQLRPVSFTLNVQRHAEGSVLVACGATRVICAVSVEEGVPSFLKGKEQGWLTAEYSLLPRSTNTRTRREVNEGKPSGRTHEIQRLIGRSLRAVSDLKTLGERTVRIDCDVLEADGGTRCASVTGAWVALALANAKMISSGVLSRPFLTDQLAAVSVGIVDGKPLLDLDYVEDSGCDTDMNCVMTGAGGFVELQGTAEGNPFSDSELATLISYAKKGIKELMAAQLAALPKETANYFKR